MFEKIAALIALFEGLASKIPPPFSADIASFVKQAFGALVHKANPAQKAARLVTKAHDAAVKVAALASADDAKASELANGYVSAYEQAWDDVEPALLAYTALELAVVRAEATGDKAAIDAAHAARRPAALARDAAVRNAFSRLLGGS